MKKSLPVIQETSGLDGLLGDKPVEFSSEISEEPEWKKYMPKKTALVFDKDYISFSELATWMECSTKHYLKYIKNIRLDGPTEHTEFGQIIHDCLESYLSEREMPDTAVAVCELDHRFSSLPNAKSLKPKDWQEQIGPILDSVPAFMEEKFPGWEFVGAEVELLEEIEGFPRKFHGYIDGIIRVPKKIRKGATKRPEGYDYYIIDWKTTSWGWTADKKIDPKKTFQLVLYKYFWSKKMNIPLSQIKTGFVLLKRTAKTPERCEYIPVSVGPVAMSKAMETLTTALVSMKKFLFTKETGSCRMCKYYKTEHCQ